MNDLLLVLCTFPDSDSARQLGTELIEKQLAACVNLVPGVESIYRWEGRVTTAGEVLAVFKTTPADYPTFATALAAGHPDEVPEIVALRPESVAEAYQKWVAGEVVPAITAGLRLR